MSAKRTLARVHVPDAAGAEARAWALVRTAYAERLPPRPRRRRRRLAVVVASTALVGSIALSPAGATVGHLITRALGVHDAARALFSLPAPGQVLISGPDGTWSIAADGATRRLGPWGQASWSPHGKFVAVAQGSELAAVDPRGELRWALARPAVRDPRWYSPSGLRVAYLSEHSLRVIAGDGTDDHLVAKAAASVAPAWRPEHPYELAYVTSSGRIVVRDGDTGRLLWQARAGIAVDQLIWSPAGARLLAVSKTSVRVYTAGGQLVSARSLPSGAPVLDAALAPDGQTLALALGGSHGEVLLVNVGDAGTGARGLLSGPGLGQIAWAPDGDWLLVTWPAANQWVFIHVVGAPRIAAVSRIAQQFSAAGRRVYPGLDAWCCTATTGGAG